MMPVSHHFKLFGSIVHPTKARRMRCAYDRLYNFYIHRPLNFGLGIDTIEMKVWRKLNTLWNDERWWGNNP